MAKKIRKILSTGAGEVIEYLTMNDICEDYPSLCKGGEDTDFIKKSLSGNGFFMLKDLKLRDGSVSDIGFASVGPYDYAFIFFDEGRENIRIDDVLNYDIRTFLNGLTSKREFFIKDLRRFLNGSISASELEYRHKSISGIFERYPIGDSTIYFNIDFDDLVEREALNEGDPWLIRAVHSDDYYDLEEYDIAKDNWLDGWLNKYVFRGESLQKYHELIKKLKPNNFSNLGDKEYSEINDLIFTYFREEIDEILEEFVRLKNEEVKLATRDAVDKETHLAFDPYGISIDWYDETVSMKASNLYTLMRIENIYTLGAEDAIQKIISEIFIDSRFAGFDEARYEFENAKYFDWEQMNATSIKYLDEMLEKFDDNKDSYSKFNNIMNKFGFEVDSVTRRDLGNDIKIQILGFDSNKNVVRIKVYPQNQFMKAFTVDIDDFEEFLNNPKDFI
jgi:hypothetical protein